MSMQGRSTRAAVALGVLITVIVAAAIPSLRTGLNGAEAAPCLACREGRAAPLADRAGPLGRRHAPARGQPDRRVGLAGRHRERQGPP